MTDSVGLQIGQFGRAPSLLKIIGQMGIEADVLEMSLVGIQIGTAPIGAQIDLRRQVDEVALRLYFMTDAIIVDLIGQQMLAGPL